MMRNIVDYWRTKMSYNSDVIGNFSSHKVNIWCYLAWCTLQIERDPLPNDLTILHLLRCLTLFLTPVYRVSVYFTSINVQVVHKYNRSITNISKMMLENYTNKGESFNYFTTQIQGLCGVTTFLSGSKYVSIYILWNMYLLNV